MLLEMILCASICPPGLNATFTVEIMDFEMEYSYNDIMAVLSTLRSYLVIRMWTYFTRYTQEKAERICEINQFETNPTFAMKSTLKDSAYSAITIILILFTGLSAYIIFIAERNERTYLDDGLVYDGAIST